MIMTEVCGGQNPFHKPEHIPISLLLIETVVSWMSFDKTKT